MILIKTMIDIVLPFIRNPLEKSNHPKRYGDILFRYGIDCASESKVKFWSKIKQILKIVPSMEDGA